MKSISRTPSQSTELNRFQDAAVPAINTLLSSPFFQPTVLDVALTTSPTVVSHGLNRTPAGYIVVGLTAAASITYSAKDSKTITLTASSATTASILFF